MRKEGLLKKIVNGRLFKNKVYSLIIMLLGLLTIKLLEEDCTVFIFTLLIGLPVFFAKKNVIV